MTGLVGVFFRNGQPAEESALEASLAALGERGPGSPSVVKMGPCSLGVVSPPSTPSDPHSQPRAFHRESGVSLILDGRLDDREQLARDLPHHRTDCPDDLSDANLALAAYLQLGVDFASRLLGDFALALWDARRGRLICVRDASGLKPLYYGASNNRFVFGSNPRSVLAHPDISRDLNHGMIGEYLAFAFNDQEQTLYSAVHRLPPAHMIVVDRTRMRITRYWDIDPHRRIRHRHSNDYVQHFQTLFRTAVKDRLRRAGPIGVTLSGGMDSSAVAGVAQGLLNEEGNGERLRAYSTVYPGEACDESRYVDAVAERWALTSVRLPWTQFESCPWVGQASRYLDIPEYPSETRSAPLYQAAQADGVRVLLTGEGGDYWHNGSTLPHRHLWEAGRLKDLMGEVRYEAGYSGNLNALRLLGASMGWGLIPGRIRRWRESRRSAAPPPPFLSPAFMRDIGLDHRLRRNGCADRFPDASQWQIAKLGRSGILIHFYEMIERSVAGHGIELRHPLLDRRLIEFSLAIPDHMRRRGNIDRYLLRQSMAQVYPATVAARRDAASFGIVLARALTLPGVRDVLESPALLERPWIDPDLYRKFLDETLSQCRSNGVAGHRAMFYLWTLFAIEVWYREARGGQTGTG